MIFMSFVVLLVQSFYLIEQIEGHGYLADPPARSSAWLFDNDFIECCQHFNHLEMSCGGMYQHWIVNGGKCSVCGEAYDLQPKLLGVGDAMYLGKIVRTYTQGSVIPVTVVLTANHLGVFEFRVCNIDNDPDRDATQSCLDLNVLKVSKTATEYPIQASYATVDVNVTLPPDLICKHCVFQWKYRTGNSWGVASTGKACLGCGRENEEFYGCSDIAIVASDSTIVNSPVSTSTVVSIRKEVTSTPSQKCTPAVVFSQSYDLSSVMEQYCEKICSTNCAEDNIDGDKKIYKGCVRSCQVLCTCA